MVDDEQATADINNISTDDAKTNEELRAGSHDYLRRAYENYITERLGRIQNQYKQSILAKSNTKWSFRHWSNLMGSGDL